MQAILSVAHICTGTRPHLPTSAPGLAPICPHLRRDLPTSAGIAQRKRRAGRALRRRAGRALRHRAGRALRHRAGRAMRRIVLRACPRHRSRSRARVLPSLPLQVVKDASARLPEPLVYEQSPGKKGLLRVGYCSQALPRYP